MHAVRPPTPVANECCVQGDIQSVAGGIVVLNDTLRLYISGRSAKSRDGTMVKGDGVTSAGVLELRRDVSSAQQAPGLSACSCRAKPCADDVIIVMTHIVCHQSGAISKPRCHHCHDNDDTHCHDVVSRDLHRLSRRSARRPPRS